MLLVSRESGVEFRQHGQVTRRALAQKPPHSAPYLATGRLATLWAVDDLETANLMQYVYAGLKEHAAEKARVLQQVQKVLITRPESRRPYFWAPFLLIGAPR